MRFQFMCLTKQIRIVSASDPMHSSLEVGHVFAHFPVPIFPLHRSKEATMLHVVQLLQRYDLVPHRKPSKNYAKENGQC